MKNVFNHSMNQKTGVFFARTKAAMVHDVFIWCSTKLIQVQLGKVLRDFEWEEICLLSITSAV